MAARRHGKHVHHWRALVVSFAALVLTLVAVAPALAATKATGASVLSGTQVKITFDQSVDTAAASTTRYSISPELSVTAALRTDKNHAVILTTAPQVNAVSYTVTVSGITGLTPDPQTVLFIGTTKPANSTSSFQDDFNRGSGLVLDDTPISGPWTTLDINSSPAGQAGIVTTPVLGLGSGALRSFVSSLDPSLDNACVRYAIDGSEYFASAYLYVPPGQGWTTGQEVGLIRLNEFASTAHARLTAFYESASAFTIKVNWKQSAAIGYHGEVTVASGVTFGEWHWIQLHVKNGAAGVGKMQAFIDGRLAYQQDTIPVRSQVMQFVEAGIMHMVSTDPSATTITDQVRVGVTYQLPSVTFDTAAPSSVALSSPAGGSVVSGGTASLAATATDDYSIQRIDFLIDGQVVASDDTAPFATTCDVAPFDSGTHAFAARAYDTSGLATTSTAVSVTIDNGGPAILSPSVAPAAFSPNGDGYQDAAAITYSTAVACDQKVDILDAVDTVVRTFGGWTPQPAGDYALSWAGLDDATVPVPDGHYTVRIRTRDAHLRITTERLPLTVNRVLDSVGRTPAVISPNGDTFFDTTAVSYRLNGSATVAIAIEQLDGTLLRTVQATTSQAAGGYSGVVWDGKDDGGVTAPDGQYTIRVSAVSALGLIDVDTRSLDPPKLVTVDTTAPTGALTIDGGAYATNDAATLTLAATDANGPLEMRLHDAGGAWGAWQPLDPSVPWTLPGADGEKTVEVQYRDIAGNLSDVAGDAIVLDREAPTTTDNTDGLPHQVFTVVLAPSDATSGVALTEYRIDGGSWRDGASATLRLKIRHKRAGLSRGTHLVEYRSTDAAGNLETVKSCQVILGG